MIRKILLVASLVLIFESSNSQVLISLILGDNLNTGKIEFGLDGGLSLLSQSGLNDASNLPDLNLGFYFDIKLKDGPWFIHTGVIVKSRMGAGDLPVYSLDDPNLDNTFAGGSVDRKVNYFNVPILIKYRFKNRLYLETGPQLGLRYTAFDHFSNTINDQELTYKVDIADNYHRLDAGWTTGLGYRIAKGYGMNVGVRYYAGMVDVTIDDTGSSVKNNAMYLVVGIPIGVGKARERAAKKAEEQKSN
jgi:hypothetical protein